MSLDKKLKDTEFVMKYSWGKLIHLLKRQFDSWATRELVMHGHGRFKIGHMPFIMNIGTEGTSNNDLAKKARVTKQAMSKVAQELLELGLIKAKPDAKDKRSTIFYLTEKGKTLVVDARVCVKDLMDEYRDVVGKARFDAMIETMLMIVEYNEAKIIPDED